MGCDLDNPKGLAWLALIAPLVLLYLLRVRRKRRLVGSVWLWQQALRDALAQEPLRRFTPQIPLVLQLLALFLLVFALAQPTSRGQREPAEHVGIILDLSASMGAKGPNGESRLELAKQAVTRIIDGLAPGSKAILVAAGRRARVVAPLDSDRHRLRERLGVLETEEVEGKLSDALALLNDRLAGLSGTRHLVLVTDGALAERSPLTSKLPVEEVRVGTPTANAAIVRFVVSESRSPGAPNQVQALVLVENFSQQPRELDVTLRLKDDTEPLASRRLTLAAGERTPIQLSFSPKAGDRGRGLLVALSPGDALSADDSAYGLVPNVQPLPVVLSPKGRNPWVKRALSADPGVRISEMELEELEATPPPHDAFVVVSGACPDTLPGGDFLIVNPPTGPCRGNQIEPSLATPVVNPWSRQDPRLRFVTLDQLSILQSRAIRPASESAILAGTGPSALIADISLSGRRGTLLAFAPGDSNWPLQASFVLFIRNLVELARQHSAQGSVAPLQTGDPIPLRVPVDVDNTQLLGPGGRTTLRAHSGMTVIPLATRAGFYEVSWSGRQPDTRLVAVNLTSDRESDLSSRPLEWLQRGEAQATPALTAPIERWGWILGVLALGFLVADTWWYTRQRRLAGQSLSTRRASV